jgi:glycosyltransferase involved in cell wall biosynthesis
MGGNRVFVVHDYVEKNPYGPDQEVRKRYATRQVLAIASHGGHPLERMETEVAASSNLQKLTLLITGPPGKLAGRLSKLPRNVSYLGMLPMDNYLALKASVDFALNITDEPYTLSHVLFEYSASSLAVISTRIGVVEETFGDALYYVDSSDLPTVAAAIQAFLEAPAMVSEFKERMKKKFAELTARRASEVERLKAIVSGVEHQGA